MKRVLFLISFWGILASVYLQPPDYAKIKIEHFVKCDQVEDQEYSSTCWSFASSSFIESEIYRQQGIFYDLSEMYFARYSYLNKVNAFLKSGGTIYFTPGGQFHDVLEVIKEHGAVPENEYTGHVHQPYYHNHEMLDTLVSKYTYSILQLGRQFATANDWKVYNNLFDTYLGKNVEKFNYNGRKYSPESFVKNVLQFDPDDYIEITSYTHHPFNEPFILEDKFNWMKKEYYNVPLADFMEIVDHAILNGYSVCWDGDVTEETFDQELWAAYLPQGTASDQTARQVTYGNHSTEIDHMMHLVGFGKDDKGGIWYYIKNSWGKGGPNLGYFCMSLDYFKLKTVAIIVHKDAIPGSIKSKLKL